LNIFNQFGLTPVINARGSFTPLGVSRSSTAVAQATASALQEFFIIDELQAKASQMLCSFSGAKAATITHCAAAGLTLSIAATMTGSDPHLVNQLPDANGLANRVLIPAGHVVNYGHSILTDIRLAVAVPVIVGSEKTCSLSDLKAAFLDHQVTCLLLVSSRLVTGESIDFKAAIEAAHRQQIPVIIDAAAQDMRMAELVALGADLIVISAHKYLASPTAGLILESIKLVDACRAQEVGIGRAMKPSKEAIIGVLAAIEEREKLDVNQWTQLQREKVLRAIKSLENLAGITAQELPDPVGMPFSRLLIHVDCNLAKWNARILAKHLHECNPPIWVMEHALDVGDLILEMVSLNNTEVDTISSRVVSFATNA
jgi:uncharacterized pyridoxal phosphate-dependent enzyme